MCKDLASGVFEILPEDGYNLGTLKKRHGGVMEITDKEYERLKAVFSKTA